MSRTTAEIFRTACGLTRPPRLIAEDEAGAVVASLEMERPFAFIGHDERADLRLDHPEVSHLHALVQVVGGAPFVHDLDSRHGIAWDGLIQSFGWLDHGRVQIGPFRLRFESDDPRAPIADRPDPLASVDAAGRPELPAVALEFPGRTAAYPEWPVRRELVMIGRAKDCRVRLSGADVSRHHAALIRTPAGVFAIDLLSRRGLAINGSPIAWDRLELGDELAVGRQLLRMIPWGEGEKAGLPATRRIAPPPASTRPNSATSLVLPDNLDPETLAPLLEQFGQMQDQMFDQFQQTLSMVMNTFGKMHREQMDLLREELDEVRRLAADRPGVAPVAPPRPSPSPTPPPRPETPKRPEAASARGRQPHPRPDLTPSSEAVLPGPEMHRLLAARIAAMREEQDGRWQKILGILSGRRNAPEAP